jgi:hypothetical protein
MSSSSGARSRCPRALARSPRCARGWSVEPPRVGFARPLTAAHPPPFAAFRRLSQARLVALVAEHLLDTSFARSAAAASPDVAANLAHATADAVAALPRLATGVDVNVKFLLHGDCVRAFEATAELAAFDACGVDLVHGWLPDAGEDAEAAAAVAGKSYNEVAELAVAAAGAAAPPPPPPPRRAPAAPALDAAALGAALERSLRVAIPEAAGEPGAGGSAPGSRASAESGDSVRSAVNAMMRDIVREAFRTPPTSEPGSTTGAAASAPRPLPPPAVPPRVAEEPEEEEGAAPPPSAANASASDLQAPTTALASAPAEPPAPPPGAAAARRFLEATASQLTGRGLAALRAALPEAAPAVLFRNNHFNAVARVGGRLLVLVTDEGYAREGDVVWEHLAGVRGDTELLSWDLAPFRAHAVVVVGGGAFDGEAGGGGGEAGGGTAGGAPAGGWAAAGGGADADFALALQLQEEEAARAGEARARDAAARGRAADEAARRAGDAGAGGGGGAAPLPPPARRPPLPKPPKKPKSDCALM